jgi:thiol-disulfide isomerase/thioredoxin
MRFYTSKRRRFLLCVQTSICLFFSHFSLAQQVNVLKPDVLLKMIENCEDDQKIKVYNFWATWCAPCIREIPQFEEVNVSYGNVDVILINLDDVDLLDQKVKPFIKKRAITSKVLLLDETDLNGFINSIEKSWSGAIPATLIIDCSNRNRLFFEQEFKEGELTQTIEKILKSRKSKI